jgi:hypothetical protein
MYRDGRGPRPADTRATGPREESAPERAGPGDDRSPRRPGPPATIRQDPAVVGHFRRNPDSRALWAPGGNHGADLADLSPADRTAAEDTPARRAGQEYFTHTLGT